MNIEKSYNSETGKTTWKFSQWYFKFYFWLGLILTWLYISAFAVGLIVGLIVSIAEEL